MNKEKMPRYLQVREIIRSRIENGEYKQGTAIPSENQLAEMFDINRLTVRSAVDVLVHDGLLQRVHGKGVYVLGDSGDYEEIMAEHGAFTDRTKDDEQDVVIRELTKSKRPAGNKYANLFSMEPSDEIYYVEHLKLRDSEPFVVEELYLPKEILPNLDQVETSLFSIHDIFHFYDLKLSQMRQTMEVVPGNARIRKRLNMEEHTALIMLTVEYFDNQGRLITHGRSFIRSDKMRFTVKVHG